MDLVNLGIQGCQELLVNRAVRQILSLQNDLRKSRHRGLLLVLADQVDQIIPVLQGFLRSLGNLFHPLSRYSLALLLVQGVHPVRGDLEVLEFLEILAAQVALLFLLDQKVLEVHRYPSLLWVQWVPQVREILVLLAVR